MAKGTMNVVILVGRLGSDTDLRFSPNGTAYAKVSVATVEKVPVGGGKYEDMVEWNRIVAFGKQAEILGQYGKKGRIISVEGSLRTREWDDNNGVKRHRTEIIVKDFELIGSNGSTGSNQQSDENENKPVPSTSGKKSSGGKKSSDHPIDELMNSVDDDVPF